MRVKDIAAETNRGMHLDVIVFLLNLILMNLLTSYYLEQVRLATEGDPLAKFVLGLSFLGMLILPASGAVLKRWHFHQRMRAQHEGERNANASIKRRNRRSQKQVTAGSGAERKPMTLPFDPLELKSNLA